MQSELSFLLELLLEHKLPKDTRTAVAARIKTVEVSLPQSQAAIQAQTNNNSRLRNAQVSVPPEAAALAAQMASQANADVPASRAQFVASPSAAEPIPASAFGTTNAAAAALAQRNQLIAEASQGFNKKGGPVGRGHGDKR
jgi:hypothetical protein